jgi:phosphoserine aminotransferase
MNKPNVKPENPSFSSGPCAKRPGWNASLLEKAFVGRSHRAKDGVARLKKVIDRHREILKIPDDYRIAIVAGSDTGAVEMAMWSMMGARGVDVLHWENFGGEWYTDILTQLKIQPMNEHKAAYGLMPDLSKVDFNHDVIFTWNGTTSGVRVPDAEWIPSDRAGLTFCDATSAVFAYDLDWSKLDITTWSWQKALGSEAAHGMLVLSPRAVERLLSYVPDRPLPKIFRLVKDGKIIEGVYEGLTLNTPSMLCVEDCLDALDWVESVGGVAGIMARSSANFDLIEEWVSKTEWVDFLAPVKETRSKTSVCLKIVDPEIAALSQEDQDKFVKSMTSLLAAEDAAYDCGSYATAPPGLRLWVGATVENKNVQAVLPWLDWAFHEIKRKTI